MLNYARSDRVHDSQPCSLYTSASRKHDRCRLSHAFEDALTAKTVIQADQQCS